SSALLLQLYGFWHLKCREFRLHTARFLVRTCPSTRDCALGDNQCFFWLLADPCLNPYLRCGIHLIVWVIFQSTVSWLWTYLLHWVPKTNDVIRTGLKTDIIQRFLAAVHLGQILNGNRH